MNRYLKNTDNDWFKQRLTGTMLAMTAAVMILLLRLFYLQIIEGTEYRRLSENNCIRLQSIASPRGLIFDRNGKRLVDNRPSFDLSIVLKDAKPVDETLAKLSAYTGIPVEELMDALDRKKRKVVYKPILLKQDIGRDALAAIEAHRLDLPGVVLDIKPVRHYIHSGSASHLLGYLGEINAKELKSKRYSGTRGGDYIGRFGVEKVYEDLLRGKRGGRQVEVDAKGQCVRVLKSVPADPGKNLFLSIDWDLQQRAEELLDGRAGAVAAMDPSNGEILVLASSPSFNQNAFVSGLSHKDWNALSSNPFRPMENKAIQGEYPPASTYKIITAIAALEEGVADADDTVHCSGAYPYGDRVFRCWKKYGHGKVNMVKALAESCDVYFYQVGQKLGVDRLAWYARACGLGAKTGIKLDHEAEGLIPTAAWKKRRTGVAWQGGETLSVCIGQGYNLSTPLQLLSMTSAVANGGVRYKPQIVKSVRTADGDIVQESRPEIIGRLPVSENTLDIVKKGLWEVVNGKKGTARVARLDNVEICGKTGTAQVFSRKKGEEESDEEYAYHLKPHAWFVAYAPAENPEIAIAVIIEHGEHGSSAASPVARELVKLYYSKKDTDGKQPES